MYEITSPVFSQIVLDLDAGKTFTITAIDNSLEGIYIQDITLNGKAYPNYYLHHEDILNGGELVLHMGNKPKI